MPGHTRRHARIAVGGIAHETNTFASAPTTLDDFRQRALLTGNALLMNAQGTDGALGGIIAAADGRAELLPTLFASATPSGMVTAATFATLRDGLLSRLRAHHRRYPGVDGVVLVLHGAMVVDGVDDAEGKLLRGVRDLVGDRCPVVVVVDFHANLSPAMVDAVDLVIPYRTYPHVDTCARGEVALGLCLDLIAGAVQPRTAWRSLPLLSPLPSQTTEGDGAFATLAAMANGLATRPGVLNVSLVPGFPYSDVPEAGASVLVTTDTDHDLAGTLADELAARWWNERSAMQTAGVPLDRLDPALFRPTQEGPIVLADIADNPGAGAPGDSTGVLRHCFEHGYAGIALATLPDPGAVAACHAAGVGVTLRLAVGGKRSPWSGQPIERDWTIRHLGSGVFANRGPIGAGGTTRLGRTATVESAGITVMLCERRMQTLEPAAFEAGGIDPHRMNALVVKSSVHFRAGFRGVTRQMIDCEAPGLSTSHLHTLPYRHAPRPTPTREAPARV
jgi:microcystin degradation protein MlrC